jgi:hypothetical protein
MDVRSGSTIQVQPSCHNSNTDLRGKDKVVWIEFIWLRMKSSEDCFEHGNESSDSI